MRALTFISYLVISLYVLIVLGFEYNRLFGSSVWSLLLAVPAYLGIMLALIYVPLFWATKETRETARNGALLPLIYASMASFSHVALFLAAISALFLFWKIGSVGEPLSHWLNCKLKLN